MTRISRQLTAALPAAGQRRRQWLRTTLCGLGAILVFEPFRATAQGDLPPLAVDDPAAAALGYHEDAGTVDATAYPRHAAGQFCHNCALYQGVGETGRGPCAIFPGKTVAAGGWCNAWAPKAA